MASKIPIDLNQPANTLSAIADKVRKDLVVKNDYQLSKNENGVNLIILNSKKEKSLV